MDSACDSHDLLLDPSFRALFDERHSFLYIKDGIGRYVWINRRCAEALKISSEGAYGKSDFDLFPEPIADALRRNDSAVLAAGLPVTVDEVMMIDEQPHTFRAKRIPFADPVSGRRYICAIATDITPRAPADTRGSGSDAPMFGNKLVVIIDDDPAVLMALSMILESWGLRTLGARSLADLSAQLPGLAGAPDLVVADHYLPAGATGKDAVDMLRQHYGTPIPALILTGDTSPLRASEAATNGFRLLLKPVHPQDLLQAVQDLL